MNLVSALKTRNTVTENGMVTNESSLDKCLDLFFKIGGSRSSEEDQIVSRFSLAFADSPLNAMRILFWGRDVRGGAGERRFFRICLPHLAEHHTDVLLKNLSLIPEYGRWDDLLCLIGTKAEAHALILIGEALNSGDRLCAKWMPRKGTNANAIRKYFSLTPKEYRNLLTSSTKVVEQKMCANKFDEIEYSSVPSLAASRYQAAFLRKDSDRYRNYMAELAKPAEERDPNVKINAQAVYPYDVIKSLKRGVWEVSNEQWKSLPNFLEGSNDMILPVVDVSGSMETSVSRSNQSLTCMDVAISLGLYISERNEGPFKNHFITFSERPILQELNGDLKERYIQLRNADWGMSTNLESVFNLILEQASKNNVPNEEMPSKILILSDMQFNEATSGKNTALEMIKEKYTEAGYDCPSIIFWNIQSRGEDVPVSFDERGTALISGFSPSIMKSILSGNDITPIKVMMETINNTRYEKISV